MDLPNQIENISIARGLRHTPHLCAVKMHE